MLFFSLSYLSTDTSIVFVFSFYICSWLSNKPPQEIINNSISLLLSFVCHFLKNNQRFLHFCFEKCFLNWLIPINSLWPTKYRKSINPDMLFGCRLSNVHFAPTWIIWDYRPSATGICTVSGQFSSIIWKWENQNISNDQKKFKITIIGINLQRTQA